MKDIVDYAMPMMQLEKSLRQIHDLCLQKRYLEASEQVNHVEYHVNLLRKNLICMQLEEQR